MGGARPEDQARRRPLPTQGRYRSPKRPNRAIWAIPAVLAALVIVLLVAEARRQSAAPQATPAVTAAVLAGLVGVPESAWDAAGATAATPPILIPAAARATAVPTLLYMGAEYCPYCAAERWSLISALSRFGSFQGVSLTSSSSTDIFPNTPTFALDKATYQSQYLQVQTVEMQGRTPGPDGTYPVLQTPTAAQNALIDKYDAPPYVPASTTQQSGSIPFILVGGQYMWSGSQFSPGLLSGLTWGPVAAQLAAASTSLAKTILGNANEVAAALCASDGAQPAAVCGSAGVTAAAALLPKAST